MALNNRESESALMDTPDTGQEPSAREKALEKALEGLFSDENMAMKADLQPKQITAIARGKVFAERYNSKAMETLITHMLQLSVSKNRRGREEFVRLMQSTKEDTPNSEPDANMFQRLFNS